MSHDSNLIQVSKEDLKELIAESTYQSHKNLANNHSDALNLVKTSLELNKKDIQTIMNSLNEIKEQYKNKEQETKKINLENEQRFNKIEKFLLVVGVSVGTLMITNGRELISFITSIV